MNLAKINEVIKASPAIQIQSKISLLQRRAWNVLLANAYNELPDKDIHSVSMVELAAKLGFDSGNQEYLKEVLKSIVDCTVEWNLLNKDNKQIWGAASLLAFVEIEDGICCYQFPHPLRQKLHNPRIYAKLNLRLQNRFKGQYALVLWEICFDYFDADRDQGETPFIPLETFKSLMGLAETDYPVFKVLNRDLVKPAIKEVNDVTDYHIEVEQKRVNRRVAELKFRIERVKQVPVQETIFPDIEDLSPVAIELVQVDVDRKIAIDIAELQWEFVSPEKLSEPGTYPDFMTYVSEKIEMSYAGANVENRAGYIIEAIRENYQNESVKKQRAERAERTKEKELEDLTEAFNVKRKNIVRQAIQADPGLIERAAERIVTPFVRNQLVKYDTVVAGYSESSMIKVEIEGIIADEFCQETLAPVNAAYADEKARILGG